RSVRTAGPAPAARPSSASPEQRVEPGARRARRRRRAGTPAAEAEVVAKVSGLFVDLRLSLRFTAVVVIRGVVKHAVHATMQIRAAVQAGVAAADPFDSADVVPAALAYTLH